MQPCTAGKEITALLYMHANKTEKLIVLKRWKRAEPEIKN